MRPVDGVAAAAGGGLPASGAGATWLDAVPLLGQASGVRRARALRSRQGTSFLLTSGGRVRVRRQGCPLGPRLLLAADGPNVLEHYDALLTALEGRADVVVLEPPGTGASAPARGFDFTPGAFARVAAEALDEVGPRTLIFPCYLGLVAQLVAVDRPEQVTRLVMPQTPSWEDLEAWAGRVDGRRLLRTPLLGQLLVRARRRQLARQWYRHSAGDPGLGAALSATADEAAAFGGCFCLASLMQGFERSPRRAPAAPRVPTAVVWGPRDRTHRGSDPARTCPGAEVVRFDDCGHSPELEAPERFARWLLDWHRAARG